MRSELDNVDDATFAVAEQPATIFLHAASPTECNRLITGTSSSHSRR